MKDGGEHKYKYSLVQIVGNALLIKTLHRGKIPETQKTIHEPIQDVAERATLFSHLTSTLDIIHYLK